MKLVSFIVEDGFDLGEFSRWSDSHGLFRNVSFVEDTMGKDWSVWSNVCYNLATSCYESLVSEDRLAEIEEAQSEMLNSIREAG